MNLRSQRRIAARLLKVGQNRVWISNEPAKEEFLEGSITRGDIRRAVSWGDIRAKPERGNSRARSRHRALQRAKGRQRGSGSRKGAAKARNPKKRAWIRRIRPLRQRLKQLRDEGRLDPGSYRLFYRRAKGGMYSSRAHLEQSLRAAGAITKEAK